MPIPEPEPGLVVSYAYLWHREHLVGMEEGRKDRPSVIVLAVARESDGALLVTVLPITHLAPADPAEAVEIPAAVKRHSASTTNVPGSSSPRATSSSGRATICEGGPRATGTTTAFYPRDSSNTCAMPSWPVGGREA